MPDPTSFALTTEDVGDSVRVLVVRGDADRFRAEAVSRAIETGRADDRDVVVDLSAATYLDSSMLAALVGASEQGRRRSQALVLVVDTPRLRRSFEVKGLQTILRVTSSRDQALDLLARPADQADQADQAERPAPEQA